MTNFQLLFLSPNLLKSQSAIMVRGIGDDQFSTFVPESKFAKIPKSHHGGEEGVGDDQFPIFLFPSLNLLISQSTIKVKGGGKGGGEIGDDQFPILVSESKFATIPKSHYGREKGVGDDQFPIFVSESKFAKIPKSHYSGACGGEGGGELVMTNSQLLFLSLYLLKSQSPIVVGGWGGWCW